jgi:Fe-S cluster biogenesis protein NfuA/nitrite reductase/ring-hydroxylating ferredoxin subunit
MPGHREPEGVERIDELVLRLETGPDADVRSTATELIQALMEFHGAGLERLLAIVRASPAPDATMDQLAQDELVRSLLLLYGLHPVDVETRVRDALDRTRPYLRSHGGNVELAGVEADGSVRLRMQGSCHGCPSSAVTLKLAIEAAIREAAPEVTDILVLDDAVAQPSLPLPLLDPRPAPSNGNGHTRHGNGHLAAEAAWEPVDLSGIAEGTHGVMPVRGRGLLFCRLDDTCYAYGDRCPACGADLATGRFANRTLACPACGQFYDVVRAGRALGRPDLHLDPFPLLVENGRARVALPGADAATTAGSP